MRVLIIGCGYVGFPLGEKLARAGHHVFGLRRSVTAAGELKSAGILPLLGDVTKPQTLLDLPHQFDWVVNCAASGGGDAETYRQLYLEGNRNVIAWLTPAPPQKYIYTSSTSVYGQNDGSVVTENDPAEPESETGRILVATENLLLAAGKKNFPVSILRLSGIYGPQRGYWLKQFLRGATRIEADAGEYVNMIHREDVIGAIVAALERAPENSLFNASDNEPVTRGAFCGWLAERLGLPEPEFVPTPGAENRKRGASNKRVSNEQLRRRLAYEFKYPTFREGYAAELAGLGR